MFICWPGPSAEMCRGFLLDTKILEIQWRIFAGDFPGGFFRTLFPTKMRGKNPATKSGGPKIKIREKSVLPKNRGTPQYWGQGYPNPRNNLPRGWSLWAVCASGS